MDEFSYAWRNKKISLLKSTQNTRDLGGYKAKNGKITKWYRFIRSDAPVSPCEEDILFMKEHRITTVIDLRGEKEVVSKPNGFVDVKSIRYLNCPVEEGSGVPESVEAVPVSYLAIACAENMPAIFKYIANSDGGVMFHCSAGKDRTGVVSAILLCHAGVKDQDIIENYVVTKEYSKGRLELIHKNYPEIDMNIVTPNEMYMEEFLRLFREKFEDTNHYFQKLGLSQAEINRITQLLLGE